MASGRFPVLTRIIQRVWLQAVCLAGLLAGHVLLQWFPEEKPRPIYPKLLSFAVVWVCAWIAARILSIFRNMPYVEANLTPNLRLIIFTFGRFLIFSLAFLVALDAVGVSITPFLASLGVGSLAVGLALQDTLGNLFSGFYLYADRPITIGDWIKLESGIEGQVVQIGWRSTRLLVAQENMIIIPNSKLSSSVLFNFNLPTPTTTLILPVGVAYEADLDQAESALLEAVARVASRHPDRIADTGSPVVRYAKFGDSSVDLNLSVQIRAFPDLPLIRHELIKEVKRELARVAIEIPYPKRDVRMVPALDPTH